LTDKWFLQLEAVVHTVVNDQCRDGSKPVRVAILDTGVNADHPSIENEVKPGGRIRHWKGFPHQFDPLRDQCGHGTHIASVLLQTAPRSALYIARVADNKGNLQANDDYAAAAEVIGQDFLFGDNGRQSFGLWNKMLMLYPYRGV
jgi:subtilisin family serine protease